MKPRHPREISWRGFIPRVCSDSMRQALAQVFASNLPLVRPVSRRARLLWASTFAALAIFALPAYSFAEPKAKETAQPRVVSSAKPVVVLPRESSRQQAKNFVSIGPIFGFTGHLDTPVTGILGAELSYVRYPGAAFRFGIGGFAQAQTVGFTHARFAFGPQFNFMMFGAEVGAYLEEGAGKYATTVGVHASPFVSLGFFSAAFRLAVPLGTLTEGDSYDIDLGLVCAIKMPIPLDGQLFGLAFH